MKLIITEKPDVARSIGKVLNINKRHDGWMEGNGYYLTWCVGHLVELAQADEYNAAFKKWTLSDLPIIPENWLYKVSHSTEKQFQVVKKLMLDSNVDRLICATDAGREGELIFRLVYYQAKCKKPFDRLWISSMVDKSIKDGFDNLLDGNSKDNLYQSALCRSHADWLVGINGSRLFSLLYDGKLNVGRVQTPTLAMIVNRELQIREFIKEKYFINHIDLDGLDAVGEKVNALQADCILKATDGKDAIIISVEKSVESVKSPALYDLTTLQREANRYFGLTAAETLDATQSLYEKKLATYPRTDSEYITKDMVESVDQLHPITLQFMGISSLEHRPDINILVNDKKVSDHHAILPTTEIKNLNKESISKNERLILELIVNRLVLATAPRHQYSETVVNADCSGYLFKAKGKTVVVAGWKQYESQFKNRMNITEKKKEEIVFQDIQNGQIFKSVKASISEHVTSPPKRFNEDTLLSAMDTAGNEFIEEGADKKGIGTTATRASIIEKLISAEYIQRQKRYFIPTESGISLISAVPELIKSPKLTAEWENWLKEIETGKLSNTVFNGMIKQFVNDLINQNRVVDESLTGKFKQSKVRESIGKCPRCNQPVYESEKNFYCSNRDCQFVLWKENRFFTDKKKKITKRIAEDFLKDGFSNVTGLYSQKKETKYDATILMEDTGDKYVNFKLEFRK